MSAPVGEGTAGGRQPAVLVVTHYYAEHGGGVEIVANEVAQRLARGGVRCEWMATRSPGALPGAAATGRVTRLPAAGWNLTERRFGFPYPLWGPVGVVRLFQAVGRADLVHLHDTLYMGNVVAWLWAKLCRKPVVVTQHVGLVPYSRRLVRLLHSGANHTLGRLVLSFSRVVFCSPKVADYFSRFVRFGRPPAMIPNGVDTGVFTPVDEGERRAIRRRLGLEPDRPVMLFVGRFVEKKGMHLLRKMAARFPAWRWVFAGWGPDDPAAWDLPNVVSVGALPHEETPDYYRAADLFVLPSVGEGFPLVVQEAMACGLPVLVSLDTALGAPGVESVSWVSDLAPEALAATLDAALADPAALAGRRSAVAAYARRQWSWEACVARYAEVYRTALGGAPDGT